MSVQDAGSIEEMQLDEGLRTKEDSSSTLERVHRRSFYLDTDDRTLFAWLHTPAFTESLDHGVVICPPIGFEQLHGHRGLRHLADELARRRIPTLRFDWAGTGDSLGDDLDPERLKTWIDDVRQAVRWMKSKRGCRRVSVVGLRIGATIASLGLENEDVENLVLWAPVTTGRTYVRELTLIDKTSDVKRPAEPDPAGTIDAAGFLMSRETAIDLSKCNLINATPRCRRILISDRDDAPVDQHVIDHFSALHISTEQTVLPGLAGMMAEPHRSQVPSVAIQQIVSWIDRHVTEAGAQTHWNPGRHHELQQHQQTRWTAPNTDGIEIRETLFQISRSPDLFGILTSPDNSDTADRPLILLLNAGSAYRIGPGRMSVETAREFAVHGFSTLRLDLCGLGDSVTSIVSHENDSYVATMFRDIEITLKQVVDRLGVQRCVLLGLCSGAYAAFQSAVQIPDQTLIESIMINPLSYFWREGMTIDDAPSAKMIEQHYYFQSALKPEKWLKLLSGKSRIGFSGALRILAKKLGLVKQVDEFKTCQTPLARCNPYVSHPRTRDLNADLGRVKANGRPLSMFFATTDPGYEIMMCQAGRRAKQMIRDKQIDVRFIDNADHTFSRRESRHELIRGLTEHLCRRYAPSATTRAEEVRQG